MKTLHALLVLVALSSCEATRGAAATKPCGWYFTAGRSVSPNASVTWLSGVWTGSFDSTPGDHTYAELMWMPMQGGTMVGMARTSPITGHAPTTTLTVEYFQIREEAGGKLVYIEKPDAATPLRFEQVEAKDGFAAFERRDAGVVTRVSFRLRQDGAGLLELTRESPTERRAGRLYREV